MRTTSLYIINTDCNLTCSSYVCSYGVVVTGQRGTRPHICSREEILKDAVTDTYIFFFYRIRFLFACFRLMPQMRQLILPAYVFLCVYSVVVSVPVV